MHRNKSSYTLAYGQAAAIKRRMLYWANQYNILIFLDSNGYTSTPGSYECLLAAGSSGSTAGDDEDMLAALQSLHDDRRDWLFGHIAYDYKKVLEPGLHIRHTAAATFPLLHFFTPHTVCYINKEQTAFFIESFDDPELVYLAITGTPDEAQGASLPKVNFTHVTEKEDYLKTIEKLRSHIADGDCYEINFCSKGYCEDVVAEPLQLFKALNALSPAPFAAFYRYNDQYMMCASPERYLRKEGAMLCSQPIKGTARRDTDSVKDAEIKNALKNDPKELAENVMIVDLVRNDLARSCDTGSVQVPELFGIYTFPQVHQLISTVCGTLRKEVPFTDAIRHSFPMGSMTGAPKYKVMELIETYERSARELFSGTVGYITPDGDFDFNVVIRSLFYNTATKYLSYHTGGAITYDSDPEKEWEEMRLKAWALERIFA